MAAARFPGVPMARGPISDASLLRWAMALVLRFCILFSCLEESFPLMIVQPLGSIGWFEIDIKTLPAGKKYLEPASAMFSYLPFSLRVYFSSLEPSAANQVLEAD